MHQEDYRGMGASIWGKIRGDNAGKDQLPAGTRKTCEDSLIKSKTETMRGFWSGACVAADKAIVQWVKVPPCHLPDSGT